MYNCTYACSQSLNGAIYCVCNDRMKTPYLHTCEMLSVYYCMYIQCVVMIIQTAIIIIIIEMLDLLSYTKGDRNGYYNSVQVKVVVREVFNIFPLRGFFFVK